MDLIVMLYVILVQVFFVMPKKIYDMLDLPPLEKCYVDVNLVDAAAKKPLGRVNDVLIKLIIILSPLILLSWILNAMLLKLLNSCEGLLKLLMLVK